MLKIYLLGSPMITIGDRQVEFDTRKALAMLAYLVVTGMPHQRDTLAALFWPENDQAGARAALRRTLSVLKAGLPGDSLHITREQIGMHPGGRCWCDVQEFSKLVSLLVSQLISHSGSRTSAGELNSTEFMAKLQAAVNLYRGDFLAGFSLRDSPAFDDWQYLQSDFYKQHLATALSELAAAQCSQNSFADAISSGRRLLGLDPLREDAHRLLMLCYTRAGQRNAALQQYRSCVRILDQELGVSPVPETTQLYTRILEGEDIPMPAEKPEFEKEVPLASSEVGLDSKPFLSPFPLVGRSRQTETMLKLYQQEARRGCVLVLKGEPGIGKTRLAENFLAFAHKQGAPIMRARGYPGQTSLAYALFIDAFQSLTWDAARVKQIRQLPQGTLREAARLIPAADLTRSSPGDSWSDTPLARARFFDAIRQVIVTVLSGTPPGVLFLDDVHWADPASLELLSYLTRRLPGQSIFVLLTTSSEPLPETLQQLIYESQRAQNGSTLALDRLKETELRDLVQVGMHTDPNQSREIAARLFQESEGLPFFVVEYLELLSQEQLAGRDLEQLTRQALPVPNNVLNLLKSRLSSLDETTLQVLAAAAIVGRSFDFDTLQGVSGRSLQETLSSLEILLSKGIVEEISLAHGTHLSTYDFSHDKLRQYVTQQTSSVRRRLLHRRAAESLLQQNRSSRDAMAHASLIAFHYQQAGQDELAAGYYQAAGDQAASIYAHRLAIQYYQDALAAGAKEPALLHENIGDLHTRSGEYQAAITSYHRAAALVSPDGAARLEHKLGIVHQRRGEYELAECHYQAALDMSADDSIETCSTLIDWSQVKRLQGDLEQAVLLAEKALALAEAHTWSALIAKAHNHLGILSRLRGDPGKARQHLETSLAITREIHEPAVEVAALNSLALLAAEEAEVSTGIQYSQAALEICRKIGDRHQEAAILNHLAELQHALHEEALSMDYLKQAVAIFAEIGADGEAQTPQIWMLSEW